MKSFSSYILILLTFFNLSSLAVNSNELQKKESFFYSQLIAQDKSHLAIESLVYTLNIFFNIFSNIECEECPSTPAVIKLQEAIYVKFQGEIAKFARLLKNSLNEQDLAKQKLISELKSTLDYLIAPDIQPRFQPHQNSTRIVSNAASAPVLKAHLQKVSNLLKEKGGVQTEANDNLLISSLILRNLADWLTHSEAFMVHFVSNADDNADVVGAKLASAQTIFAIYKDILKWIGKTPNQFPIREEVETLHFDLVKKLREFVSHSDSDIFSSKSSSTSSRGDDQYLTQLEEYIEFFKSVRSNSLFNRIRLEAELIFILAIPCQSSLGS